MNADILGTSVLPEIGAKADTIEKEHLRRLALRDKKKVPQCNRKIISPKRAKKRNRRVKLGMQS